MRLASFSALTTSQQQQLVSIENLCHINPWSFDSLIRQTQTNSYYAHAALTDNFQVNCAEVQAYIIGLPIIGTTDWELLNLTVAPPFQGQGIGRRLLSDVLKHLINTGVERVLLEVRVSNMVALHLYKGIGFQQIGLRKHYYPTAHLTKREDACVMACNVLNLFHDEQLTDNSLAHAGGTAA